MQHVKKWSLVTPFWVYFLLAGVLGWSANEFRLAEEQRGATMARLLEGPPPAVTPIQDYAPPAQAAGDKLTELALRVQVSTLHQLRLVRSVNGLTRSEQVLYVLLAPDAPPRSSEAYGAIVLPEEQHDSFSAWMIAQASHDAAFGPNGPILTIAGLSGAPAAENQARTAIREQGFSLAPGFLFIDPFYQGRVAALAAAADQKGLALIPGFLPAAGLVLLGLLRLIGGGLAARAGRARAARTTVPVAAHPEDTAPEHVRRSEDTPDFIKALSRHHRPQPAKAKRGLWCLKAPDQRANLGNQKLPRADTGRALLVWVPVLLILAGLTGVTLHRGGVFGEAGQNLVATVAGATAHYSTEYLPPQIIGLGGEALVKLSEGQAAAASALEGVAFLQLPEVLTLRDRAIAAVTSMDLMVWRATGLPLIVFAALLALILLVLRVSLKQRRPESYAAGREDPFDRLLQRRRKDAAGRA